MKILILGGTVFLGRHVVEAALARSHEVTLFTRGQHNPDLFPGVEKLRGDRDGSLDVLRGRSWDAAIDTSGYVPRVVAASADLLRDSVGHYSFVSTLSVYTDVSRPGMDESAPVGTLEDESVEEITGETYGPLKALCEKAVEERLRGRTLVVRPGLIVGPDDPTDRFTYWPVRVARGGDVIAPGRLDRAIQVIDVRDLAQWMVSMTERQAAGVFNATGPDYVLTMGTLLDACRAVSGSDARFVWVDETFLLDRDVTPWTELPLWVPDTPEYAGFNAVDCSKATGAGLVFRPISDTIDDTLVWTETRPPDHEWRAGMAPEREQEILREWKMQENG